MSNALYYGLLATAERTFGIGDIADVVPWMSSTISTGIAFMRASGLRTMSNGNGDGNGESDLYRTVSCA